MLIVRIGARVSIKEWTMSSETGSNKLKAKDFITVGIFTAIIFVVEFACGMLGYIHPFIVASYVVLTLW